MNFIQKSCTNWGYPQGTKGRNGQKPLAIVIHIAEGMEPGVSSWFANPNSSASSHFLVCKDGRIVQYVDESNAAWTNGDVNKPSQKLAKYPSVNPNLWTLTIENEGYTGQTLTTAHWNALVELVADLCKRWNIAPSRDTILGHYEFNSVTRPNCPGTGIPLDKLVADVQTKLAPPNPDQWKLDAVEKAFKYGILKDVEGWKKKINDPIDAGSMIQMLVNMFEKLNKS